MYENYGINIMKGRFLALAVNYRINMKGMFSDLEENIIYGQFGTELWSGQNITG